MKTAIILTGHMRTFDKCLPALHWHVFRHFPRADFYVSTIADADAGKAELLRTRYPDSHVEIAAVPEQPDCVAEMRAMGVNLPDEWSAGAHYTHEPYPITVHPQAILRQLHQLREGWLAYGLAGRPVDCIVRCRPDLFFHAADLSRLKGRALGCERTAFLPWWGRFGGGNDRFAIMGAPSAEAYFRTYDHIPFLMGQGCPLHPESLLAASLEAGSCTVDHTLDVDFSALRENGDMRAPEVMDLDVAKLMLGTFRRG